jgi:hypothetical protein
VLNGRRSVSQNTACIQTDRRKLSAGRKQRHLDAFQAAARGFRQLDHIWIVGSALSRPFAQRRHLPAQPGTRVAVLPRQDFAILVEESSGGLEFELVDALQEPANRLVRLDHTLAAGHLGAHGARMQDDDGDPSRFEVVG